MLEHIEDWTGNVRLIPNNGLLKSPPSLGFDVPLATALCKTFLLRMLKDS
jgi:hypothetical protein